MKIRKATLTSLPERVDVERPLKARRYSRTVKTYRLICAILGLTWGLQASEWRPSESLLDAVRHIESADGLMTVGDNGLSLGNYQLSKAAWLDVNAWRRARGVATYRYERDVWSERVSRSYAADYLRILHTRLRKQLGRAPSPIEVYGAYNMGLTSFVKNGYRLSAVNLRGQESAMQD